MRCFLIGFAGFFVAGFLVLLAMAGYADYAARASLSETMAAAAAVRTTVAEELRDNRKLKPRPAQPAIAGADYSRVSDDGTIVFRSARHGQIIVYEPSVQAGGVTWKCIGSPPKDVPADCR